jgi:hypothetical protein
LSVVLEAPSRVKPWYVADAFGLVAIVFGVAALLAGFWTQFGEAREITQPSDLRVVLPLGGVALVAAVIALVRRERHLQLPVVSLAMALSAPLLGWVVLVAGVAAAAAVTMLIIAKFH